MIKAVSLLLMLFISASVRGSVQDGRGHQNGRVRTPDLSSRETDDRKLDLLFDIQGLESQIALLTQPLEVTSARVYLADALWWLDKDRSKKLLEQSYEETLPDEKETARQRAQGVGTPMDWPTRESTALLRIRNAALSIASREPAFLQRLNDLGKKKLGKQQQVSALSSLASQALLAGDVDKASQIIKAAADVEPTKMPTSLAIWKIAVRDRDAADRLIIYYLDRLNQYPLDRDSAGPVYTMLRELLFPTRSIIQWFKLSSLQSPGPDAVKAYIGFVITSFESLFERDPSAAALNRGVLLTIWPLLQRYSPELIPAFLRLQAATTTGKPDVLPTQQWNETDGNYQDDIKTAIHTQKPSDIDVAFSKAFFAEDYKQARKLLELLPGSARKEDLLNRVDAMDALALIAKGDLEEARRTAQKMGISVYFDQVYSMLAKACIEKNDMYCTVATLNEALDRSKKLRSKNELPATMAFYTEQLAQIDEVTGLQLINELVDAANHIDNSGVSYGQPSFKPSIFCALLPKYKGAMIDAVGNLKNRFERIAALATIYASGARTLERESKHIHSD